MICPNCGKEAPDNTAFCKECGSPFNAAIPQQNVPQMQQGMMPPQYAPQMWITLILSIACMIVCIIFCGKTKQSNQQPAQPMQ